MDQTLLLKKAATFDYPEIIPVSIGFLPAAWKKYGDELNKIMTKYPDLFSKSSTHYRYSETDLSATYKLGETVDEWGCVWSNIDEGMEAYVTGHPIKNVEDIRKLQIPSNRDGRMPHGFMYLRILDLMGFENAMVEFAEESEEIQILVDKVLEYNLIQIDEILKRCGDIVFFGDDLGMQKGLAIGANRWRKYFKPCYTQIYKKVHDAGKLVYMHTDGMIYEIMPDIQQAGADIINPQFRANGLENLVRVCKGKIPINLDLDRQLFPFATPKELDDHVRECVEKLWLPQGGLGLNVELNKDVPLENIEAMCNAVNKYMHYSGTKI